MSADRRLVSACMLGSFDGTTAPAWLLERIRDGLGGVLLFAQNVIDDEQVAALCASLRSVRTDVVIAIDEEGGDVTRLDADTGSEMPSPAAFGAVDDVGLTAAAYAQLGRRVRSLGIDLTLAPCADINSNPRNPIIGLRAFGATSDRVVRHVVAAIDGFRTGGLAVCAKHYPGHGDTEADTHLGPARISGSLASLTERELLPFAAAVAAGVDAILTAHVVADALDDAPVSLSGKWTEHLRRTTGFAGAIITDALDMDAVAGGRGVVGIADAAVRALVAGADLLCLGSNSDAAMTDTVLDSAVAALAAGVIDRATLARSAARVHALHRSARCDDRVTDGAAAARLVAGAVIAVEGALPAGPFSVLECRPQLSMACFNVRWGLADLCRDLGWPTRSVCATDDLDTACASVLAAAGDRPVLVVVRATGVHPWQASVVERCVRARPAGPVVVVEMGWPSGTLPSGVVSIVSYGAARSSAQAVIARLTTVLDGHLVIEES